MRRIQTPEAFGSALIEQTQFHSLSFEGPDPYSMAGGLGTRVVGLTQALADQGFDTHLWFVGDPDRPGHERHGPLHLHRWCQWISKFWGGGVYDGDWEKANDYATSLPPFMVSRVLLPHLLRGGRAVVLAEEWQTVNAVLHLDWLLSRAGVRDRVTMVWNANNTFGFDQIDWGLLRQSASITTVSRYMRHRMQEWRVDAAVIPNGLTPDCYEPPDRAGVQQIRRQTKHRTLITKMARFDPDKRWLGSIRIAAEMKRQGWRPLLVARGGSEAHGQEVLRLARDCGLRVDDRRAPAGSGIRGLTETLKNVDEVDVINLQSFVDADTRRVLFRASNAVLANSSHEPFGLVGLEAMAVGGVACTGCSGEDYAVPGRNALVLQTDDPHEFLSLYRTLQDDSRGLDGIRRAGRTTARHYAWPEVIRRNISPWVEMITAPVQ